MTMKYCRHRYKDVRGFIGGCGTCPYTDDYQDCKDYVRIAVPAQGGSAA